MGERERILDHLENDYTEPVRDPVWKHIYLSRGLLKVAEQEPFQKLDRIRQLGPAYLVYPGATHTRRNHSLGVFHLARRLITILARRNQADPASRDRGPSALPVDMTLEGVKAFLCAALLHDIGHFPFAHSLKDLSVEAHETLAGRQIVSDLAPVIRSSLRVEPEAVAAIIDRRAEYHGPENVRFFWSILSGALDIDKLDYLNRDAFFCGVPYGIQDVDFILEEVFPHPREGVAISPKGVTALENILFSKYLMYKTVYWHKTVRIATAMIKKGIATGLAEGVIRREDLYGLDDEEFFSRFTSARCASFRLIEDVRRRALYKQVWREGFREDRDVHRRLEDIAARLALETEIAREASARIGRAVGPDSIVVDVPERLSFELAVPLTEPVPSGDSEGVQAVSLFGGLGDFPAALRSVTISARRDEDLLSTLEKMDLARFISS